MLSLVRFFAGVILIALPWSGLRASDDLTIMTEDFPPFNYVEGNSLKGMGPEVVRTLMQRLEAERPIKVMGWKHAYDLTLNEPNMVLFSMVRTAEREGSFQWVGPILSVREYFYTSSLYEQDAITREQAKAVRGILVQDGGAHFQLLSSEGFTNLLPYSNVDKHLQMLLSGRGTLLLLNDLTVAHQMRHQGLSLDLIKPVLKLEQSDHYIAFSNGTAPEIVAAWQAELDAMRVDGTLQTIEAEYLTN
ncbi:substrate-binding periplasmic protein [Aestuariispira insulae]|uniref:Amino acid ABC transporter substrate-binding protein (PAAT family) n=1 Tax=Aestuariispira insulae TaxID=1461337 RepID=A0A3D9H6I6_9PROT|nr:transporter substrate-binding domain-containing protein [Aestuariispira insulae]RED45110.1 amino acid ABC transporter substrate-binding protein (PAAT family) [Aestuariispira insulae]